MPRPDHERTRRVHTPAGSESPGSPTGYGEAASELAHQYESVSFEEVHQEVLGLIPPPPSRVLDIGAGSGRDAAALARRGHAVTAVEPVAKLRAWAQETHSGLGIRWIDDRLPRLSRLDGEHGRFDLLLLSAVWMHLPATERLPAMQRLVELLSRDGLIIMSLRHGPTPPGRQMFDVPADEVVASARRSGLQVIHRGREPDRLGRAEVSWSRIVLRQADGESGPVPVR